VEAVREVKEECERDDKHNNHNGVHAQNIRRKFTVPQGKPWFVHQEFTFAGTLLT
jgi:hypothetical protein